MSPKDPAHSSLPSFVLELGMHGAKKRFPNGRKLTKNERACLPVVAAINEEVRQRSAEAADLAHSPDVAWFLRQFLNPVSLASRKRATLPKRPLVNKAIAHLEALYDAHDPSIPPSASPSTPRKKLTAALDRWEEAFARRREDPRWKDISGHPVTRLQLHDWHAELAAMKLDVIPALSIPEEFLRALHMVEDWDDLLERHGHTGERFSLREEVVRLHNWPGDQWENGDDYASAQKRFHRRLRRARALSTDQERDAVMLRALYLREGLLLGPVDPLQWLLAVCRFRWAVPEVLDVRPELMTWRFVEWVARLATASEEESVPVPQWVARVEDPREVPRQWLSAVSGPNLMIDLDEDVVTALPPGCRVRRLVLSAAGPLGPDWTVYWVDSEWEDSRPILDLVESAKLHPKVVFVSDSKPADLADTIRPFLDVAYEIPTNPLTAYSHVPTVAPFFPEHPDAGL